MSIQSLLGIDDNIVPPRGNSAYLTSFAAAAMAFIAVFALSLSLAVGRLADHWSDELAQSATVRIVAQADGVDAQVATVLAVLATTPGVASAAEMSADDQIKLLSPWLGDGLPLGTLSLPRLINVSFDGDGPDFNSLTLRLAAEAPDAHFDDHGYWRRPVLQSANRMRSLAVFSLLLIAGTMAAIVTLAANASLASNAAIIRTLRLIGAHDSYISRAFVRRITARTTLGAVVGTVLAAAMMLLFPSQLESGAFLSTLNPQGLEWILALLVPVFAAFTAYFATRLAAIRHLRRAA